MAKSMDTKIEQALIRFIEQTTDSKTGVRAVELLIEVRKDEKARQESKKKAAVNREMDRALGVKTDGK